MRQICIPGLIILMAAITSEADTIVVPSQNILTIQAGIDSASSGDTVLVSPGSYSENLIFRGRAIVLGSWFIATHDISYINTTIIDGTSSGTVIRIISGEGEGTSVEGFTIQNGLSPSRGGGIHISGQGTSPKICNNRILNNTCTYFDGGGISCGTGSNPTICHNHIAYNRSNNGNGGGISLSACTAYLHNNLIINNYAKL